jgi:16S rRNA (cytosine1402-N4)-methyltransferase
MTVSTEYHIPVMVEEVCQYLLTDFSGVYIDGTLGGGGHAEALLNQLAPAGRVIGLDRDAEALAFTQNRLAAFAPRLTLVQRNFSEIRQVVIDLNLGQIDGLLLDLGVSSFQLDEQRRGFSYLGAGSLDMRMSQAAGLTAADVLNTYSEQELVRIFFEYGEERFSRRIVRKVIAARKSARIEQSGLLQDIIKSVVPRNLQIKSLARIYQALRIEVNQELSSLEKCLSEVLSIIKPSGRIVVIAYHSLEDRIVKQFFRQEARQCTCPPQLPICVCGAARQRLKILTKKAISPGDSELQMNSRSRSARLRAAEKVANV